MQRTAVTPPSSSSVRFSFLSRLVIVAFALAQLGLPGTLSVLDGFIARDSRPAVVHVEAPGSKHCARVHDIDGCAICQYLAHATATRTRNPSWIAPARARLLPLITRRVVHPETALARLALPRAPSAA